jgi:hypothetical protein
MQHYIVINLWVLKQGANFLLPISPLVIYMWTLNPPNMPPHLLVHITSDD